jgi:hypothetical protein
MLATLATNVLLRHRLVDQIAFAVRAPIAVILAPAGHGKSTALQQYLASCSEPAILFAARPGETLISFSRGLLESSSILSRAALASLGEAYASAMRSSDPGGVLADWMALFFRELPSNTLIVLDDVQFGCDDAHTTSFVAALVAATKDVVSWLVAIRSVDDLPVGEWLASGDMELPVDRLDLAFTADEIRDLVMTTRSADVTDTVLDQWLAPLEGWPSAIALALRSRVSQPEVPEELTAEDIFTLLVDRLFQSLSNRERTFLTVVSKLRSIDPALFVQAGITDVNELTAGFADAGVLVPYGSDRTALRLHDLFSARFDQTTNNDKTWLSWSNRICDLLTECGRVSEALELCLKLNDVKRAIAIVRSHGLSFSASLHADLVERAIALVGCAGDHETGTDPVILAVRAAQVFRSGHVTEGTQLYAEAMLHADNPVTKARIAARITIGSILAQRFPPIGPAVLEVDASPDALAISEIASARTLQLAVAGCYSSAREVIGETIHRLQRLPDGNIPLIHYYAVGASFASFLIGDFNEAVEYSEAAVRGGSDLGQPKLLTFAYTIPIMVALARGDKLDTVYEHVRERARNEWRSGFLGTMGVSRLFQLACAVVAGDDWTIAATDRDLAGTATSEYTREFYAREASDIAIRYTWNGSFEDARALVAVPAPTIAAHRSLVRLGASAMFAAAAGQRNEALATIARTEERVQTLTCFGSGHYLWRNLCRVYEALAMMLLGDETEAQRFLSLVDGYTGPLVGAIEVVARGLAERNIAKSRKGLQMIRRRGYLGYVRMLEQVMERVAADSPRTRSARIRST